VGPYRSQQAGESSAVEDAIGHKQIDEMARGCNIDRDQLAEVLSRYIPQIIDELTPSGQLQRRG